MGLHAAGGWLKTQDAYVSVFKLEGFAIDHPGLASKSRVGGQGHPWAVMRRGPPKAWERPAGSAVYLCPTGTPTAAAPNGLAA